MTYRMVGLPDTARPKALLTCVKSRVHLAYVDIPWAMVEPMPPSIDPPLLA